MLNIEPIRIFKDNYVWVLFDLNTQQAACIDPGSADEIITFLNDNELSLSYILITHHHVDHIGGVHKLQQYSEAITYGPHHLKGCKLDRPLKEGDQIILEGLKTNFQILETPGHTLDHIAYYNSESLFCGDTLFSMGCGRLFEGTPEMMLGSLQKLFNLSDDLNVYCTHEYTKANIAFAKTVYTSDELTTYENKILAQLAKGDPTLPSKLSTEKKLNPFLRSFNKDAVNTFNQSQRTHYNALEYFTHIRQAKDNF